MDKLQMQSKNLVDENIKFIAKRFPNCVTEALDEQGKLTKLVDFDMLKQELSHVIIDGDKERYTMTWPDKKQAILTANAPIAKTLRPCKDESVGKNGTIGGFDSENLYIEGDNLDVLKLLRETYLGKIKMIYIDPPYNTGNDFVYADNFKKDIADEEDLTDYRDENSNIMWTDKFKQNPASNGRFHTDWLNMMYPRLKIAKDLLTDDGIIFISIDDNEIDNLSKIVSEIYGSQNFIAKFIWEKTVNPNSTYNNVGIVHEYILCYSKSITKLKPLELNEKDLLDYTGHDEFEKERGPFKLVGLNKTGTVNDLRPNLMYDITAPDGSIIKPNPRWRWSKDKFEKGVCEKRVVFKQSNDKWTVYYKQYLYEDTEGNKIERGSLIKSIISDCGRTTNGSLEISNILGKGIFDFPKPVDLISRLIEISTNDNDIILDFFSGSATTAHATMQLNAEDGGNRKFIMVQLPELCDEKSEAYEAGYKNICEIGKERIRRAGRKIKEEIEKSSLLFGKNAKKPLEPTVETKRALQMAYEKIDDPNDRFEQLADKKIPDIGFRCLKLDSSCMKDIYYSPNKTTQDLLTQFEDNIKEDRTPEDLLFQVMLDMGVMLSSEIKTLEINGKKVFNVNDGDLVCCFDKNINDDVVTAIAKMQPLYAVFRDASMSTDSVAVNFDQIFETYSQTTTRKII